MRGYFVKAIKLAAFAAAFCLIYSAASRVLVDPGTENYQLMATFPDEPAGSLDAVYIGGSNAFAYFQSPIAWKEYGMTVRVFASDAQPLPARRYFMDYARRAHPDALYIITVARYGTEITDSILHWSADSFPASAEKYRMIRDLTERSDCSFAQKIAVWFPLLQFHSRWNSLTSGDFHRGSNGLKGAYDENTFLTGAADVTGDYHPTDRMGEVPEGTLEYWEDFLNYCDSEGINALFIVPPQCNPEEYTAAYNTITEYISSRGYPALNLMTMMDELGMDTKSDYYNFAHTNIHGSLKVTRFIASYLAENYDFPERTGEEYRSWDEAYDKYIDIISPYLSDGELASLR